jgi:FMN reductase
MTRIAVVTGNPKPASRTHSVALAVADALAKELPGAETRPVIDLAGHAPRLFNWEDEELAELTAQVAAADIAVFASPTYKAAYTGMLKAFLDRYGNNGLAGVTAIPVMTGGWPGHLLAVEVHLRPVLVELGATVPARGLYVTEPELADLPAAVGKWATAALPLIAASVKGRLPGEMPVKGRVPAAPEKKRVCPVAIRLHVPDAADDDLVVTAGHGVLDGALDDRDHVRQPGRTGRPALVPDLVPDGRQAPAGEVGGQVVLPGAEHIDRERPVTPDGRKRLALEVEADEHQWRLKRERRDRVRGCPDWLAVRPDRGDNRDPGGEVPHRLAQLGRGDLRRARVPDLACSVVNSGHGLRLSTGNGESDMQHKNPYVMIFPLEITRRTFDTAAPSRGSSWCGPYGRRRAACPDCHRVPGLSIITTNLVGYCQAAAELAVFTGRGHGSRRPSRYLGASREDMSPAGHNY